MVLITPASWSVTFACFSSESANLSIPFFNLVISFVFCCISSATLWISSVPASLCIPSIPGIRSTYLSKPASASLRVTELCKLSPIKVIDFSLLWNNAKDKEISNTNITLELLIYELNKR
uniref:hypothetical protein n=1 Tax=Exserohilum turcicum TaxID=93612 RepID=UPI002001744F|nr:hypothetical protein M1I11_mgp094 [Exserohilum turcicum]UOU81387.1 hypothetical protein [Exserohilum turcicum]